MNSYEKKYTDPQAHLTEKQLIRYGTGDLDERELQMVEQHIVDCELCGDALEGYAMLTEEDITSSVQDIKLQLASRIDGRNEKRWTVFWKGAVAASFLLFLSLIALFIMNYPSQEKNLTQADDGRDRQESTQSSQSDPISTADKTGGLDGSPQPEIAYREEKEAVPEALQVDQIPAEKNSGKIRPEISSDEEDPGLYSSQSSGRKAEGEAKTEKFAFGETPQIAKTTKSSYNQGLVNIQDSSLELEMEMDKADHTYQNRQVSIIGPTSIRQRDGLLSPGTTNVRIIQGKVTDSMTGEALPGVKVSIPGSGINIYSQLDGTYIIPGKLGGDTLQFSFIGYEDKMLAVRDSIVKVNISLQPDFLALEEVVVVGYSTSKKSARTSSVVTEDGGPTYVPEPAIGMKRFQRYIKQNLKYPTAALEAHREGVVELEITIETDGRFSDIKPLTSLGYGLEEEAVRLIREGPDWKAAVTKEGESLQKKAVVKIPFKIK